MVSMVELNFCGLRVAVENSICPGKQGDLGGDESLQNKRQGVRDLSQKRWGPIYKPLVLALVNLSNVSTVAASRGYIVYKRNRCSPDSAQP